MLVDFTNIQQRCTLIMYMLLFRPTFTSVVYRVRSQSIPLLISENICVTSLTLRFPYLIKFVSSVVHYQYHAQVLACFPRAEVQGASSDFDNTSSLQNKYFSKFFVGLIFHIT